MFTYSLNQWLLFFYFYCFAGWIWESCFVSVKEHKWVNRGFMHGPLLPIYGSGAIVVLMTTLPFSDNLILVYLIGLLAATVLEYFTGVAMEKMFHVRYWDYSNQPLNFQGHICLTSSLGWGLFSVLMDCVIHPPIADLLLRIPDMAIQIFVYGVTITATVDFVQSFHEAMDLKELLTKITESSEELSRIQKRLEVMSAFWEEDMQLRKEQAIENTRALTDKLKGSRHFNVNLAKVRLSRSQTLTAFEELINRYLEKVESIPEVSKNKASEMKKELMELKEKVQTATIHMHERTDKKYKSSMRVLHRNPGSFSKKYADAFNLLRSLDKNSDEESELH